MFYAEFLPLPGERLTLDGDEAHHAMGARRLRPGDALELFDGRGAQARARLIALDSKRRELQLEIDTRTETRRPVPAVHLACALPKGDRQSVLLDMATQLGMQRFTPLECERSVVQPGANSADRWRRICLEACKQSRRLHLPQIDAAATPPTVAAAATAAGNAVLIAHPSGDGVGAVMARQSRIDVTFLVGPEGGFTEAEVAHAVANGARAVQLGDAILRIETAAAALLAALTLVRN
jgi:16S rRNA (uracil1498-N3)-methyltransferase